MSKQTDKATPRPWKLWRDVGHISVVESQNPFEVCAITIYKNRDRHEANAELIVRAVNEHAALCNVAEAAKHFRIVKDSPKAVELHKALDTLADVRKGSK